MRELFRRVVCAQGTVRDALPLLESMQPVMTLMESHATYVQERLRRTHFPAAQIESHFNLPALLLRFFGRRKASQYTEAVPAVAAAAATGDVESLYARL
jgi:hypothetical protein